MDNENSSIVGDPDTIRRNCEELFSQPDFIMDPQVIPTLNQYLSAGGEMEKLVQLLSSNYHSNAQLANLLGTWLADLELDDRRNISHNIHEAVESSSSVRDCFESTVSSMISKIFRPESADKIFEMDSTEGIDWLPELISCFPWRKLIYELSEQFPHCLMLNFAVKLISDAGYQHEISNINTAAQQLDIFSRVFLSSVDQVLHEHMKGQHTESYEKSFAELLHVACHSEQTFTLTQALLHIIARQENGKRAAACENIAQSLRLSADKHEQDTAALFIAMTQSEAEGISPHVTQALRTVLTKRSLNPADISQLYQAYMELVPPPVDLIRDPFFVNMLIDALFNSATRINTEHRPKYVFLLAYASSVTETIRNGSRKQSKLELDLTRDRIEVVLNLLDTADDLLSELQKFFELLHTPVVAAGLLHYIKTTILREDFLGEPLPIHFVLIDEIASLHTNLHSRLFKVLGELYENQSSINEVAEVVMERQRNIIDRFVHLLSVGMSLPVIERINTMFKEGHIDVSLVRYFGMEVLEIISPPYSTEFIAALLPIIANPEVFDAPTFEKSPASKEFIDYCAALRKK